MAKRIDGNHECPYPTCDVVVPNRLFSCLPHWRTLPQGVRIMIVNTRHLGLHNPVRRDAIEDAFAAWEVRDNIEAMGADAYVALLLKIDRDTKSR